MRSGALALVLLVLAGCEDIVKARSASRALYVGTANPMCVIACRTVIVLTDAHHASSRP